MNDDPMFDRDRDRGYDPGYDPDQDADQDLGAQGAGNQGRGKAKEVWGNPPDEQSDVVEGQRKLGQDRGDQGYDPDLDDTYDQ